MTNRDWAVLLIRLMGIWLGAGLVIDLSRAISLQQVSNRDIAGWIATAVAVLAMWSCAGWLAARAFSDVAPDALLAERWSDERRLTLAISLIGVYLTAVSLPTFVGGIIAFALAPREGSVFGGASQDETVRALVFMTKTQTVNGFASVICGLALLSYPRRIAGAVLGARRDLNIAAAGPDEEERSSV